MDLSKNTLLVLAAVLFFGLIVPQFFKKIQLSFAASIIIIGSVLGPYGLDYIHPDETMKLFGFLGATFFMLLAGFEAETLHFKSTFKSTWALIILNSAIPFLTGTAITKLFGYSWVTSLFVGIVFISSSIMLVFSDVKNLKLGNSQLGKTLKSLVVVQDIISAVLVFLIFKYMEPHSRFSLPILLGLLISSVIILRMFLPEVVSYFFQRFEKAKEEYEAKLRLVLVLLFLVLIIYSALDVHPIIAAFLIGFTLSEIPKSALIKEKLNTVGYAMFIPVYLFIIGIELDLTIFTKLSVDNYLLMSIISGLLLSKLLSGFIGGKIAAFSNKESLVIGISSTTKLTVAVSTAYAAFSLDLINNNLYTAIIMVSVITTILNPILIALIMKKRLAKNHD